MTRSWGTAFPRHRTGRRLLAALIPPAAFGLEWLCWPYIRPRVWFMFFPAVFFSSWLGGKWVGLGATAFSILSVWLCFSPVRPSLIPLRPMTVIDFAVFTVMGVLITFTHDRLKRANSRAATALRAERAAKSSLEARISERTAEVEHTLAALRESEAQFRTLANSMPNLAWWARGDGFITWYNRRWYEYTGTTPEQMEGWGWQSVHDPDMLEPVLAQWKTAIATGEMFDMEFPLRGADGTFRTFLTRVQPIKGADGKVERWFGTNTDISELKQAQETIARAKERLEERVRERTAQLEAANKELEAFSYTVSHDLKAPLRTIDGYSRLLEEEGTARLDEEGRMFLRRIRAGVAQAHELIEDLLSYSRIERCALQSVTLDLPALVRAVVAEREVELAQGGTVLDLELPELAVHADREGLAMVLRNLLENAIKFSSGGQPPKVAIGARAEADRAVLWVRDNGIGFDMQYRERIFEIFQRLQRSEAYPGTGIGLALVHRAMLRMGGTVRAESSPGQGATFFLEIPL